ncbi:MAG: hypothetical protein ACYCT9_03800 [Leptospirillum sp.]
MARMVSPKIWRWLKEALRVKSCPQNIHNHAPMEKIPNVSYCFSIANWPKIHDRLNFGELPNPKSSLKNLLKQKKELS